MTMTLEQTAGQSAADQGLALRCPRCATALTCNHCPSCGCSLRTSNGIVHALPPERVAHFARFIEDYECIRTAEGRGGESAAEYLGLPYKDSSGKHAGQWKIRARSFDYMLDHILCPNRFPDGAAIMDLGAGNCWMSYRLALAGFHPVAVDLLVNNRDGLGVAACYRSSVPGLFPRFRAEFSRLPFSSGQFDAVIFNSSFHYAEDPRLALQEALRSLRSGGIVVVSDTPWYSSEENGQKMVTERRTMFLARYGTASNSIQGIDFLTSERLRLLEQYCGIRWEIHAPWYGPMWALRPLLAKLRGRREPAVFRLYIARKD